MKIRFVALLSLILAVFTVNEAQAQTLTDHWATEVECKAALANNAVFYYPVIKKAQKLGKGEMVAGNPADACVDMDVPDRKGGREWVAIEKGRRLVYRDGVPVRLEECNNTIYAYSPVLAVAPKFEMPSDGYSCWDTNMNRLADADEDVNRDGVVNPRDCWGRDGKTIRFETNEDKSSWFDRNWKWAVPLGLGVAAVGGYAIATSGDGGDAKSGSYACAVVNAECPERDSALVQKRRQGVNIPLASILERIQ